MAHNDAVSSAVDNQSYINFTIDLCKDPRQHEHVDSFDIVPVSVRMIAVLRWMCIILYCYFHLFLAQNIF